MKAVTKDNLAHVDKLNTLLGRPTSACIGNLSLNTDSTGCMLVEIVNTAGAEYPKSKRMSSTAMNLHLTGIVEGIQMHSKALLKDTTDKHANPMDAATNNTVAHCSNKA